MLGLIIQENAGPDNTGARPESVRGSEEPELNLEIGKYRRTGGCWPDNTGVGPDNTGGCWA